jgi:hypothetical protein
MPLFPWEKTSIANGPAAEAGGASNATSETIPMPKISS